MFLEFVVEFVCCLSVVLKVNIAIYCWITEIHLRELHYKIKNDTTTTISLLLQILCENMLLPLVSLLVTCPQLKDQFWKCLSQQPIIQI